MGFLIEVNFRKKTVQNRDYVYENFKQSEILIPCQFQELYSTFMNRVLNAIFFQGLGTVDVLFYKHFRGLNKNWD